VTRRRLDTELVRRGLAASRAEAQEAVRDGLVLVSGSPATKVATMVDDDQPLVLRGVARRFVSRGGDKLRAALDRFDVDLAGADALDAGASTGGFTDCLLQAGAARVIAVDVGYGQLAWSLRTDDRVVVMERTNVRELAPASLPFVPSLVVADLSFISLSIVLPALVSVASPDATFVLLVKPQFEAGPKDVGSGGVVRDPAVWSRVLHESVARSTASGIAPLGLMASPVVGPAGNVEFLLYGRRGAERVTLDVDAVVAEGEGIRG
jgi:23S rRNA (cytidine1920-2'-O)/16S rRNA (cytidine1409-2'-O)-methyltransferase